MKILKLIKEKEAIFFPIFDIALNGANYFFHIYCSWYLFSKDYGVLNSLLSIVSILFVSGISFQVFTAREVAQRKNDDFLFKFIKYIIIFSIVSTIIFLSSSNLLIKITHSNMTNIILILLIFISNMFLSVFRGVLQGKKQFMNLNMNFYVEVGCKMLLLLILLPQYRTISIVLATILIGMSCAIIHILLILKNKVTFVRKKIHINIGEVRDIFISNFFIYYFTSFDMIVVNYFIQDISGIFAVVLRYSQILLFVSFSLFTIFLPSLSEKAHDKKEFKKGAVFFFRIFLIISVIILIFYYFVMPKTVPILFGSKYIIAEKYIFLGALTYFMLVLCFYIVNLNIALKKRSYLVYLAIASTILSVILINIAENIKFILYSEIIVYTLLFITLSYDLKKELNKRGDASVESRKK